MSEIPRLSPFIAKAVNEYPLAGWAAHRLLGNVQKPSTDSQLEGSIWHAAILGGNEIAVLDFDAYRSNDAKAAKAEALAAGKIPVIARKWENYQLGAARIKRSLSDMGIEFGGEVVEWFEWTEYTDAGAPVECSGVADHRFELHISDLKTDPAMTPAAARRSIENSHALYQDAAYRSAVSKKFDVDLERTSMTYIFVQTDEPFAVYPVKMSGEFRELSHLAWRRAIHTWHECLSKGTAREFWPGPASGTVSLEPSGWRLQEEMEWEAMR